MGKNNQRRTVPESVLDKILGDDKMTVPSNKKLKSGEQAADRTLQKKTFIRQGRAMGGPDNPRGGRFKNEDVRHQVESGVGTHPQEGSTSRGRDIYNENVVRKEKGADFPNDKSYSRLAQDTIDEIGRDQFYKMPFAKAAEILGLKGGVDENAYQGLSPKDKGHFWNYSVADMKRNPDEILKQLAAMAQDKVISARPTTPVAPNRDPSLVPQDDIKARILKEMLGGK